MPFPKFFFSSSSDNITSATLTKDIQAAPVGAGMAEPLEDHYISHHHMLKWIEETQQKLPAATPLIRREAFSADPLLKGTIYPYLKNVLLQNFTIQTKDNKLYSAAINEITDYLETLNLMQVFREDFLNFAILDGHSYRRMDPDTQGNVVRLEKIEPSSVEMYNDPWDSSIVAYHQRARVKTSWSTYGTTTDVDSWFIPFGNDLSDVNATYIQDRDVGNDQRVYDLFESYKTKYGISDITNLRIASAERIIAMHNSERLVTTNYDECRDISNPAPIDSVLLAIWLKRLLLVNAPNLIFIVLSPFIHLKMGILKETKDLAGNPIILSSLPKKPAPGSPNHAVELANYMAFENALKESMKTLLKCLKEGGVYATGPDQELKPVESSRSVSFQLIKGLIDQLNEEIGLAFGFPMALVLATGTELASSRNILQIFNSVHAGERTEYEAVANKLINRMFEGKTWQGTTIENEKEITVTYSFDEIKARFVLDTPDTADLLQEAQTFKTKAETLTQIKGLGAGRDDLQALGEEYGFGLLGLDDYDTQGNTDGLFEAGGPAKINAILKSCLCDILQEEGVISVSPTAPSGFNEKRVTKQLKDAYEEARNTLDVLFEGQ
jgi:hypothetical protein